MPTHEEATADVNARLNRLKEIGAGLRVGRVLGDRVLVKTIIPRTELDDYKKKGLIIPEAYAKTYIPLPTTGIVIAVGEGAADDHVPPVVHEGDMVLFSKVSGLDFTINEQDMRIISTKEILAVLVDTDQSVVEVTNVE